MDGTVSSSRAGNEDTLVSQYSLASVLIKRAAEVDGASGRREELLQHAEGLARRSLEGFQALAQPEDVNDGVKQVSEILVALGKDDEAMEFIVENAQ